MLNNIITQWLIRRALEIGGMVGALVVFYQGLPPDVQAMIGRLITTGDWRSITLGALVPLIASIFGYVWSWRATVRPHVVTTDAKQVILPRESSSARQADAVAAAAPPRRTLWDVLKGR